MDQFVIQSLQACNCEKFTHVFAENEIDEESFLLLSVDDLRILLPGKIGPQKKIFLKIQEELRKQSPDKTSPDLIPTGLNDVSSSSSGQDSFISLCSSGQSSLTSSTSSASLLISLDDIKIHKEKIIGTPGNFGKVYLGEIKSSQSIVAVKVLKVETDYDLSSFESELKIMANVGKHKNLLELLGFCTIDYPTKECILITEYCELRDLHYHLMYGRDTFVDDLKNDNVDGLRKTLGKVFDSLTKKRYTSVQSLTIGNASLSSSQLLKWSLEVSEGMEYLSQKQIVHADLAARNILISNSREAKIGDFGLSRSLYEKLYIRKDSTCLLPWRWAAPECLGEGKFSVWSDIWSYGITLWEIFSLAQVPYAGFGLTTEFQSNLESGFRLRKPQFASSEIYSMMKRCWNMVPAQRIPFPEISKQLSKMIVVFQSKTDPIQRTMPVAPMPMPNVYYVDEINLDSNKDFLKWATGLGIPEITASDLAIDKASNIGAGRFGIILKGTVRGVPVAVKTLRKDNTYKKHLRSILSELQVLTLLGDHTGIIQFIGVQTTKGIISVCTRYYSRGSLYNFLKRGRYRHEVETPRTSHSWSTTAQQSDYSRSRSGYVAILGNWTFSDYYNFMDLFNWSNQIASAMNYLNSKLIIHGDLTTRNVLLDDEKQIKLSGFSELSRQYGYVGANYQLSESAILPWAWAAPETLRDATFSAYTEIWSFGVTLWEIFSLGKHPYGGLNFSFDFVEKLENGLRLEKPNLATTYLYTNVMTECWDEIPENRPSFQMILERLNDITDGAQSHELLEVSL